MVNTVVAKARRIPIGMDTDAAKFAPDKDDFLSKKVDTHFVGDLDLKFALLLLKPSSAVLKPILLSLIEPGE